MKKKPGRRVTAKPISQDGIILRDAKKPLPVPVTNETVACAIGHEKDCTRCVWSQAVTGVYGDLVKDVVTGTRITKLLLSDGTGVRYATPSSLRPVIREWDETGKWNQEPGVYILGVLPKTQRIGYAPADPNPAPQKGQHGGKIRKATRDTRSFVAMGLK